MDGPGLHFLFESIAYAAGFALYRRERTRWGDVVTDPQRTSVIVAAILGAAIGSKVLGWATDPTALAAGWGDLSFWMGGKTIVGALLGGTIAVEWIKQRQGVTTRTGDLFAIPLAAGIAIGRLGCFLAGLEDRTYGTPTSLPWAVDFGDGIPRHPTQLYEIAFLMVLIAGLVRLRPVLRNGGLFRSFLISYFGWRFAIDFWKPEVAIAGLSAIQWAALAGCVWLGRDIGQFFVGRRPLAHG